ncbi:barstar family protein [Streptomyces sp. NBC_01190]|uniref:barstar family protein n=1 Tax=Streptomyces sp. NBC_01190 TaxID=2903767 RepID=UPI003863655A|nr:barstar family protein [Streptomyces sp. NBC_01190]
MLVLDLADVHDRPSFMDRCTADLRLPDWFCRNWDSLADCLTDLSWWPAEPGGRRLRVRNWHGYAAARPREWRIFKDVLRDAEIFWRNTDTELVVGWEDGQDSGGDRGDRGDSGGGAPGGPPAQ